MFPVHDLLPGLLLCAAVLACLATFMALNGSEARRRRVAWDRFRALIRIRGVSVPLRDALYTWARVHCPATPHLVLSRRQDFDRFARTEAQRQRHDPSAQQALTELRVRLGFKATSARPRSTHDLAPGERLSLRTDSGQTHDLRVTAVDELGIEVAMLRGRARLERGWASFSREGEGSYRFRTHPEGSRFLAHGTFLIEDERRREPRVELHRPPFWLAVEQLPDGNAPDDPEGVEVEVLDLSASGVAFLSDRQVRRGSELGLDLPLGEDLKIRNLRAQVLAHGYRQQGGPRPHFLHCRFVDLAEAQRKVLESFVWARLEG